MHRVKRRKEAGSPAYQPSIRRLVEEIISFGIPEEIELEDFQDYRWICIMTGVCAVIDRDTFMYLPNWINQNIKCHRAKDEK